MTESQENSPNDPRESLPEPPKRRGGRKGSVITVVKVIIAVLGIWFVGHKLRWGDSAMLPAGTTLKNVTFTQPVEVEVLGIEVQPGNRAPAAHIRFGTQKVHMDVGGEQLFETVDENLPTKTGPLGLSNDVPAVPIGMLEEKNGERVQEGLHTLVVQASGKWYLMAGAWVLLGTPFFVTAIRWRSLMRPQGIDMPLGKCLQLTFVGQFYSIMLPGITGGDLVKIVYAAKLTGSKTKSFITIILDRVIGLVALMVIAGTSAGVQLLLNRRAGGAGGVGGGADNTLLNVFLMIVLLLALLAAGATVYFSHRLRRLVGIEWFVEHFGAPDGEDVRRAKLEHLFRVVNMLLLIVAVVAIAVLAALRWGIGLKWAVQNGVLIWVGIGIMAAAMLGAAMGLVLHEMLVKRTMPVIGKLVELLVRVDETLHVYRGHFGLLAWAFFISVISQLTLPLSAWLCGLAFGMTAPVTHYLAYVPVAVLAASLPISPPQGFGVMDWLLLHFFSERGTARAGQAFALAQAVRFLPMIWNLFGAYWVVTGSYSREKESD